MDPIFVPLLLMSVFTEVRACLHCERSIKVMFEDFVLSEPDATKQITLKKITDEALLRFRVASESRMGVVDLTTLYRARTEFQSEFNRFLKTTSGTSHEAIQIVEKGRVLLQRHLDTFIANGLCPNQCGLLIRRVMDCNSCLSKKYTCPSPTGQHDCGEFPMQAEEGDQVVLDCFLPWHRLMSGRPEYKYSWAPGVLSRAERNRTDLKVLIVTEESSVVLNKLNVKESGTYQCLFQNKTGAVLYKVTFLLSVTVSPTQGPRPVLTLPTLQYKSHTSEKWRAALVPVVAAVTAGCLATSLGLIVLYRELLMRQTMSAKQDENLLQSLF